MPDRAGTRDNEADVAAAGRGSGSAGAVFALVVVAAAIAAAVDRFGVAMPLPAVLAFVPLAAGLAVAVRARSLVLRDVAGGAAPGEAGAAAGTALLSALALVAAPIAIGLSGLAGLVLVSAAVAGAAIARFGIAPALGRTGATTVAGALGTRFGARAGALAALAGLLALLPLIAAEAALAGTVLRQTLGLAEAPARALVVTAATLAALAGGRRSAMLMAAALLPVLALAYLAPVVLAAIAADALPLPWLAFADANVYATATAMPPPVAAILALLLLAGLAALPSLAAPVAEGARREGRGAVLAALLVIAAAPAYVLYARLGGIDPTVNPAGLVLNFAAYVPIGTAPALLLAGGLVAAAAVALALGLSAFGAIVGEVLYPHFVERGAPAGRRGFIARLAIIAAALLALVLSAGAFGTAALATLGLSFAAAGLAPAVMVAWNWPSARGLAVSLAIGAGLLFVAADALFALQLPALGRALGMALAPTVLGPTAWLGLPVGASGAAGAVLGLAVLSLVTLADRRPVRSPIAAEPPLLPISAETDPPSDPGVLRP